MQLRASGSGAEEVRVETVWTALQTDDASCGFWAWLFLWSRLLNFDVDKGPAGTLAVTTLKDMARCIWMSYVSNPGGLLKDVVWVVFGWLEPELDWTDIEQVVSVPIYGND